MSNAFQAGNASSNLAGDIVCSSETGGLERTSPDRNPPVSSPRSHHWRGGGRGPALLRFWSKVVFTERCWVWMAARQSRGYGSFGPGGDARSSLAHRWVYERTAGPIPAHLTIDHLCCNKLCVRPAHMQVVTRAENVSLQGSRKTHCLRGHSLPTTANRSDGRRACAECKRSSAKKAVRR